MKIVNNLTYMLSKIRDKKMLTWCKKDTTIFQTLRLKK